MSDIKRMEDKFNTLMDKYLSVVNSEFQHYEKEKSIIIENYAFELSRKVMTIVNDKYRINIDVSIISNGIISDLNKVILNYNTKYENELINYTKIEDIFMADGVDNKDRCRNVLTYLEGLKKDYLLEDKLIGSLNEIFAKRITTRILNTKPNISKEGSLRLLNNIYVFVKSETFGIINKISDNYVNLNTNISTISRKLSEAMAQMELLKPYLENEKPKTLESRVDKYKDCLEESDGDDMNKKGFTLVELLAVIVILAIITVVATSLIFRLVKKSRGDIYEENINVILKAAEKWSLDNNDTLSTTSPTCLDITDLEKEGYIAKNSLKDSRNKNNEDMVGYVKITYNSTYKQYEYNYVDSAYTGTCN